MMGKLKFIDDKSLVTRKLLNLFSLDRDLNLIEYYDSIPEDIRDRVSFDCLEKYIKSEKYKYSFIQEIEYSEDLELHNFMLKDYLNYYFGLFFSSEFWEDEVFLKFLLSIECKKLIKQLILFAKITLTMSQKELAQNKDLILKSIVKIENQKILALEPVIQRSLAFEKRTRCKKRLREQEINRLSEI